MSKKEILSWFATNSESLSVQKILLVMCISLLMAAVIFITYKITYDGARYNARFNVGNVVIVLITSVIMMMISTNIAISLGMVGALSIVRFRTAIKDPHDTIYIFWAIVEGLCVGAQVYVLAVVSTLFIAVILIGVNMYADMRSKYLIIIRGDADVDKEVIQKLLTSKFKKATVRSVNNREASCEIIAEILSKGSLEMNAVDEIKTVHGVKSVNWVLESAESVG